MILSAITLWFALVVWLLLAVVLAYERDRFGREASSPAGFTSVAGTAVLGTRLAIADYHAAAAALLAVAAVCWAVLVAPVLRHWKTPTTGIHFVLTVATEALAVLGAILAVSYRASWLLSAAAAAMVLGLVLYLFTAVRFDIRELVTGHGDHWIAGGALAISALAAGHVTQAAATLGQLRPAPCAAAGSWPSSPDAATPNAAARCWTRPARSWRPRRTRTCSTCNTSSSPPGPFAHHPRLPSTRPSRTSTSREST